MLKIILGYSPSVMLLVVKEISDFASYHGVELNPKKCKEMVISFLKYRLPCDNQIFVAGQPVEAVSSFKLLGLLIPNDLTWNLHADRVLKKANSRLYTPRLLKKAGLSSSDLVIIYSSFIRSQIEYTSPAWSAMTNIYAFMFIRVNSDTCVRVQRIIFPSKCYDELLERSGLVTLRERREKSCQNFI